MNSESTKKSSKSASNLWQVKTTDEGRVYYLHKVVILKDWKDFMEQT